jgi:hypothetical protein
LALLAYELATAGKRLKMRRARLEAMQTLSEPRLALGRDKTAACEERAQPLK